MPLSEIAEKLECQYIYDNMIYDISSMDNFDELCVLPAGENIPMKVYIAKGNRILFLPNKKMNTEVLLNGVSCGAYYSEQHDGYLLYTLRDWGNEEGGVPVNSMEKGLL